MNHENTAASRQNPFEQMLAGGGIAFDNPTDASAAYPQLWRTKWAAKSAFQRSGATTGECTGLAPLHYQRSGPGRSPALAWYDPGLVPDPAKVLAQKLGPLAWCMAGDDSVPIAVSEAEEPAEPLPDRAAIEKMSLGQLLLLQARLAAARARPTQ